MARNRASKPAGKANGHANATGAVNGNGHIESEERGADKSIHRNGPGLSERTDYSRWRLLDERGRQTWHYLEDDEDVKEWPQSTADKYFLGLPTVCIPSAYTALLANRERISPISLQREPPSTLSEMDLNSIKSYNCLQGTGPASTEGLCSCCQAWLLPGL